MSGRGNKATISNNNMQAMVKDSIKELLIEDEFINKIAEKVSEKLIQKINELETKTITLEEENCCLKRKINEIEQYTRRPNIRIFGVQEENQEKLTEKILKIFDEKLSLKNLNYRDIETCHRIGRVINGKPRPVFIRFAQYHIKAEVMSKRKGLKGSKIVIVEDLTNEKHTLYRKAANKLGKTNVWTSNGNIMVKINNEICIVKSEDDLDKL